MCAILVPSLTLPVPEALPLSQVHERPSLTIVWPSLFVAVIVKRSNPS